MTQRSASKGRGQSSGARARRTRTAPARTSWRKRVKTVLAILFLLLETAVACSLFFAMIWFKNFSMQIPNVDDLSATSNAPVATTIVSEDGVLLGKLDVENRQPVSLDEVPKQAIDATVSIEDHRFFEHPGIDLVAIGRAAWADLRRNNMTSQGASTLTQQLVRNLPQFGLSHEKKYSRKVREALIAVRLEQVYSKKDILQLYLNNIYYGAGANGIQAASKTYFNKPVKKLTLAEAALLAGLPQRPSAFSPYEHLDAAVRRRDEVLDSMRLYGHISQTELEQAKAEEPHIAPRREKRNFAFKAPYFVTYVLGLLAKRYGTDFIYSGLKIETTLNWKLQRIAEKTLEEGLQHGSEYGANQGALVTLDPNTGYIRTMVGGRNFHADQFNIITQGRRQPGSTFKVFDYSAAFDTGKANLDTSYRDEPVYYPKDPQHRFVKNYDGRYTYRNISCLDAIRFSKNTIAVQVAQDVGIKTVIEYAKKMGITTKLQPVLPTALGASEVRPLDLCSAYSLFATKGTRYKPMPVIRILDADGNLVEDHVPEPQTDILKPSTLQQMDTAFEAVVTSGSGTAARGTEQNGIVANARGKTGTTSNFRDAWFAGYTPELTTVIWVGNVHRAKNGRKVYEEMPGVAGGKLCAPIWHDFMIQAVPVQRQFRLMQQVAVDMPATPSAPADGAASNKEVPKKTKKSPDTARKNGIKPVADGALPPTNDPVTAVPGEPATATGEPATNTAPATAPARTSPEISADARDVTPTTSDTVTHSEGLRVSEPTAATPRTTPVRAVVSRTVEPAMTTVRVCVDSGGLATEWCEATKSIRVTARQAARMRRCRLHRPPPGE